MALKRKVRVTLIVVVDVLFGIAPDGSATLKHLYQQVYPSDNAKRQALDLCILQDSQFNRLNSDEREACYNHAQLLGRVEMPIAQFVTRGTAPNFVDLQRAAGQGSAPRNDIRVMQTSNGLAH